ncbi:MAG: hypothetical protein M9921_05995 [Fimbriimonadaceae bacterium]|nr:hypothetical protein [Chthonomonadaceae bacterium]MCO5296391.1 hypothetical protein [Fimbriimonadaceae bacterium]
MDEARRPASLVWFLPLTGVATLACLIQPLGLIPMFFEEPGILPVLFGIRSPEWDFGPDSWPFLVLFAIGVTALRFGFRRSPRAPAWLLVFWTLGLGFLPSLIPRGDLIDAILMGGAPDTLIGMILLNATSYADAAVTFLVLLVPWLLVAKVTLAPDFRSWFGAEPELERGYASRDRATTGWSRLRPLVLATVLISVWGAFAFLTIFSFARDESTLAALLAAGVDVLFAMLGVVPFVVCVGLILWLRYEQLTVDRGGVSLLVLRFRPFFAPWDRIRSIDVVEHDRRPRSAIIAYRSRFFVPFSFGVHAKRYEDGETAIDAILAEADQRGVPVRRWRSPDRTVLFGWSAIGLGILLLVALEIESYRLMRGFFDPDFVAHMDVLAGLFPLTSLHVASIVFVGLGFGLLSAHHRGGSRPVLLVLLAIATHTFPDPILHWLVWIAIYAIVTARLSPLIIDPVAPHPTDAQWEIAYGFLQYASLFAVVGYYAGVSLGRRRLHGKNVVREPVPDVPASLVAGSARRLDDV